MVATHNKIHIFLVGVARGDLGINRLDKIAKQHDIDYSRAKNLQDKWVADTKMIQACLVSEIM